MSKLAIIIISEAEPELSYKYMTLILYRDCDIGYSMHSYSMILASMSPVTIIIIYLIYYYVTII